MNFTKKELEIQFAVAQVREQTRLAAATFEFDPDKIRLLGEELIELQSKCSYHNSKKFNSEETKICPVCGKKMEM